MRACLDEHCLEGSMASLETQNTPIAADCSENGWKDDVR